MLHNYEGLDPKGGFSRVRLLAPLALRDFRLLWTGMCISLLGDGVFIVAMAWQVYLLSNTPTTLAMVGIAMTIPARSCPERTSARNGAGSAGLRLACGGRADRTERGW